MTTMQTLRKQLAPEDVMVLCGDYALVAHYNDNEKGTYYTPQIWAPLRAGDNLGLPFEQRHILDVTPWDHLRTLYKFKTEAEALAVAAEYVRPEVFG